MLEFDIYLSASGFQKVNKILSQTQVINYAYNIGITNPGSNRF
jgi:hypothetical protein